MSEPTNDPRSLGRGFGARRKQRLLARLELPQRSDDEEVVDFAIGHLDLTGERVSVVPTTRALYILGDIRNRIPYESIVALPSESRALVLTLCTGAWPRIRLPKRDAERISSYLRQRVAEVDQLVLVEERLHVAEGLGVDMRFRIASDRGYYGWIMRFDDGVEYTRELDATMRKRQRDIVLSGRLDVPAGKAFLDDYPPLSDGAGRQVEPDWRGTGVAIAWPRVVSFDYDDGRDCWRILWSEFQSYNYATQTNTFYLRLGDTPRGIAVQPLEAVAWLRQLEELDLPRDESLSTEKWRYGAGATW